ncbi:PilZ domain-containing protein [Methylobacterium sp.]|uniref:PilZ domain-containing protein n=1 Tax=Methylobacterium sp. TaxID=409 RepID=UPI0025EC7356|nr:PilZ domain-containing protein [Methylobacterium sp.]
MPLHEQDVVEDSESRALLARDVDAQGSTEAAFVERREPRSETNWIALIRLLDGTEISCNVKDISKSGARLGVPSRYELPETFMLKVVGRNFVCLVKLAWRRGNYVGVRIERVGKLPDPVRVEEPAVANSTAPEYKAIGSRRSRVSSF